MPFSLLYVLRYNKNKKGVRLKVIILNINFELTNSHNEITHQLSLSNPKGINETVIVHGFSIEEVEDYFCKKEGCRVISNGSININTETWTFHITKENDENIYIIFNEYLHIYLKEKKESRISLKEPIKILEAKGNINSHKDILKYFSIPQDMPFWIKEYSGELGKNLVCYYWDGEKFKNLGNKDMQELKASDKVLKNIITVTPEKNLFIADNTCNINMFLKAYPDLYFRFLYEDFIDNIEEKYEDFQRVIIVDIDGDGDVKKQILKKAENQLPLYICIPVYDHGTFYAVYEALQIVK